MIIHSDVDFEHNKTICVSPDDINFLPHFHDKYEILYFIDVKEAYFNLSGKRFPVRTGDLVCIRPSELHNLEIMTEQKYDRIIISFSPEDLNNAFSFSPEQLGGLYHVSKDGPLNKIFELCIINETVFRKREFEYWIKPCLNCILAHLRHSKAATPENVEVSNKTINDILQYVDENITQPMNAEIISQKFFVSKSWLTHNFKKMLNISLQKYITQKKLLHVERLIASGLPVTKAAESCSYASYATFFRQYKKYINDKPTNHKSSK